MLVAVIDQSLGTSTSFCSKMIPPFESVICARRFSHSTSSYGETPAFVKKRRMVRPGDFFGVDVVGVAAVVVVFWVWISAMSFSPCEVFCSLRNSVVPTSLFSSCPGAELLANAPPGFHQSCRLLRLCRPLRDFVSCLPYPPFPCRAFLYRRFAAITSSESRRQPSWSEFQLRRFMVLYFHSPREGDGRRYVTAFADRNVRATRANATREFCGLLHPALKNSVSVGPLRCVFDHRVTG